MIQLLPYELQTLICGNLSAGEKRLLVTSIRLPPQIAGPIRRQVAVGGRRATLFVLLRRRVRRLLAMLDACLPSYTYSLCNYGSAFLPFNGQCLMFSPATQVDFMCRFCDENKNRHKYWKMMNLYFQMKLII